MQCCIKIILIIIINTIIVIIIAVINMFIQDWLDPDVISIDLTT